MVEEYTVKWSSETNDAEACNTAVGTSSALGMIPAVINVKERSRPAVGDMVL